VQTLTRKDIFRLRRAMASVHNDSFFTNFRRLLRGRLPFDTFLMMRFDVGARPTLLGSWKVSGTLPPHVLGAYFEGAYRLDPFYQFDTVPPRGGLYRMSDIAPDRFYASEYFQQYFQQTGLRDEIGLLAPLPSGGMAHLSFSRLDHGCPYKRREVQCLHHYSPILLELLVTHCATTRPAGPQTHPHPAALQDLILTEMNQTLPTALTRREAQIAALVLQGHSNASAAVMLSISRETVKVHRRNLYAKLDISSPGALFTMLRHLL
jgi:DNA-binding CsgD family transcriptional regulator